MNIEDIGSETCEPVGGTGVRIVWGLHGDFETINEPKKICSESETPAADFSELGSIETPHVLKAGKYCHVINITTETGGIVSPQIGEKGRRLFENSLTFEVPGSDSKLLGASRYLKNQKIIAFVQEFGSGAWRQIGSGRLPAWVESNESSLEAAVEGKNGATITFKDKWFGPAPIYTGDVESLLQVASV